MYSSPMHIPTSVAAPRGGPGLPGASVRRHPCGSPPHTPAPTTRIEFPIPECGICHPDPTHPTTANLPTFPLPHLGVVHITCLPSEETPNPLAPQTRATLVGPHEYTLEVRRKIATDPTFTSPRPFQPSPSPHLLTDPEAPLHLLPITPNPGSQLHDPANIALVKHLTLTALTSVAPTEQ